MSCYVHKTHTRTARAHTSMSERSVRIESNKELHRRWEEGAGKKGEAKTEPNKDVFKMLLFIL